MKGTNNPEDNYIFLPILPELKKVRGILNAGKV